MRAWTLQNKFEYKRIGSEFCQAFIQLNVSREPNVVRRSCGRFSPPPLYNPPISTALRRIRELAVGEVVFRLYSSESNRREQTLVLG